MGDRRVTPPLLMFAQLLTYVRAARKRGEAIPGFLCVVDREKAALMATEHAMPLVFHDRWVKKIGVEITIYGGPLRPQDKDSGGSVLCGISARHTLSSGNPYCQFHPHFMR